MHHYQKPSIMTVTAHINVETPTGRRLLKELEKHPKAVKVEYPLPEAISGTTYTHEEVFGELVQKLNDHYGTDYKLKL